MVGTSRATDVQAGHYHAAPCAPCLLAYGVLRNDVPVLKHRLLHWMRACRSCTTAALQKSRTHCKFTSIVQLLLLRCAMTHQFDPRKRPMK